MSLSIGSMPAELLSDSTVANVGSTSAPSGLPFDVILDDQTDSSDEETGEVGGADLPVVLRAAEILAAFAAAKTADDPLTNLLSSLGNHVPASSKAGMSDLSDSTVIRSTDKEKPANEAAALLLLATQDVLKQLASLLAPPASTHTEPTGRETPRVPSVPIIDDHVPVVDGRVPVVDDRLPENPLAALADVRTSVSDVQTSAPDMRTSSLDVRTSAPDVRASGARTSPSDVRPSSLDVRTTPSDDSAPEAPVSTSTSVDPASLVIDQLLNATDERDDQLPLPDVTVPRPRTPPPTVALVDAIRLAVARDTFQDLDKGSNPSSANAGFERRNAKAGVVPAMRLTSAADSLDSLVATSAPPSAASAMALSGGEAGVVSSIIQTLRLQMRDGIATAVMHLEPDYLGAVSVSLTIEDGVVTATIQAENPQVRGWMEANAPLLRESLASQGLTLDRLIVTDDRIADEPSNRRQEHEREQQPPPRPRRNDDATTFEVVV